MNKEWAELNKQVQEQLKHRDTFQDGIVPLLKLRKLILNSLLELKDTLSNEQFSQMPLPMPKATTTKP